MKDSNIAILMATYNGARYLSEQLDSLLKQTIHEWHLYIHDDGSADNTVSIVRDYMSQHPDRISLLEYPSQGGACRNFLSMLKRIEADYYMFCDQDDVWLPEKIELSMRQMKQTEESRNKGCPVVVHTDLRIVDEQLRETHPSLWRYMAIYPDFVRTFHDCVISYVTGCAMLVNKPARQMALAINPQKAMMHDSWIVGCCHAAGGTVVSIAKPTVLYRQHGHNTLGAVAADRLTLSYRIRNFLDMQKTNWNIFTMLRSIAPFSYWQFVAAKIRYKKYIKQQQK